MKLIKLCQRAPADTSKWPKGDHEKGEVVFMPYGPEGRGFYFKEKELTLAGHAELWWSEQGKIVPQKDTPEYETMYKKWIDFAFAGFPKSKEE